MEGSAESPTQPPTKPKLPDINSILYGEYKVPPSPQTELLSKHLDLLLAYRPPEFARQEIAEIDQAMQIAQQDADPKEVNRIIQEVRSGQRWAWADGAQIGIAEDRTEMLSQVLYEAFYDMNPNTPRPPADFPRYTSAWRGHIRGAVNAQAASQKALAELPENAASEEREKTQKWADVRQRWLNRLVTAKGIERTAFAFGNAPDRDLFVQELNGLADWLAVNNHPQLDSETAKVVLKINDFIKREFPWVVDFPPGKDRCSGIFSYDIVGKTWPILAAAEKWAQFPEFQNYLNQQPVFNASLALKRLKEQLPHVPAGQQRQFRKDVVHNIKHQWQEQITRTARLIGDAIGRIKEESPLGYTQLGLDRLKQVTSPLAASLDLTPEQRHEVNKALAYLWQRATDKNHYVAETFSRSQLAGIDRGYLIIQDLFKYTPVDPFTINWLNPLGIEIRPSSIGDYEKMAAGSENSGGTFWQLKTPGGKIVPVILISPVTNVSAEESNKIQAHEFTHSAVSTMYEQSSEYHFPPSQRYGVEPGLGLEEITRRYILPRAKDEVAAFISAGTSMEDIEKYLTESPLYDYFQKNRNWWGYQDASNDAAIQTVKASYIKTIKQSLATAKIVKDSLSLQNQDLAVLLAILPMQQWKHLLFNPRTTS